ncbi:MAG: ketoacyl reductase [Clostridiales bacterium]|nr:MAG: ketoacyl reductase [Clostridiales bacterium]
MLALITGASSGIGREFAKLLSNKGYDLIIVARREAALRDLASELKTNVRIITTDLSLRQKCIDLHETLKDENIDIFINNAGFGVFGEFDKTSLEDELTMIDTNVTAMHILCKLFLIDFKKRNNGYILNTASLAALVPGGPIFSAYYATKSYVHSLTLGIYEELRREKSNVHISVLCPGPVSTEFEKVANVSFAGFGANAKDVAEYAYKQMMRKKLVIVPSFIMKFLKPLSRFVTDKTVLKIVYNIQNSKMR